MGAGRVDPQRCAESGPRGAAGGRAASLATQCTGELLRGGGGLRLCWVAARRNRCWAARARVRAMSMCQTAFRTLLPQLIVPAQRKNLHRLAFLGMPGAPRVRRLVNPPPRPKNNSLRFRQAARPSPRRRRRRTQYCALAPRATRVRSSHGVSRRTTPRLFVGCTT